MTTLTEWAIRHGVSKTAIDELVSLLKHEIPEPKPSGQPANSEQYIQTAVRLEASAAGCRLWRNNNGAFTDSKGRHIRYGLCNESSKINANLKSSDLIGIRPLLIKPEHVGHTFGIFLARECKHGLWTYRGKPREVAQKNFLELVLSLGGDAGFVKGVGTI